MIVMVIPVVFGTLVTISKGLEKRLEELELRERIETIQNIALRLARIFKGVLET